LRLAIRILTVLALGAVAAAAALGITAAQPVKYQATSVLLIPQTANRASANELIIRSIEALIVSPPVAGDIASRAQSGLSAAQVIDRTTVIRPPSSGILEVTVLDTSPTRSAALAGAAGPALLARITTLGGTISGRDAADFAVGLVNDKPTVVTVEPDRQRNALIGLGAGLLLGIGLVAGWPRRSRVIRNEREASAAFDAPLYATLPILGSGSWRAHSLDVPEDGLPIGWPPAARRLVVVGSGGRPSVRLVQLLASAIAQSGRDVLVIDAEPEERGLTTAFECEGAPGFFDCVGGLADPVSTAVLLEGDHLPREMAELIPPKAGRIMFLPAGEVDIPPSALSGGRVQNVLGRVRANATVIVHAPRIPSPYPANQFVEFADAVVLPAVAGRTRMDEAKAVSRLVTSLTPAPVHVVLLNGESSRRNDRAAPSESDSVPEDGDDVDEPTVAASTGT
jgi:capsular polysaccharide biosynthesis protein/Mrp family chromosome partitioning ATPase